jgi:hypothetical protein
VVSSITSNGGEMTPASMFELTSMAPGKATVDATFTKSPDDRFVFMLLPEIAQILANELLSAVRRLG